METVVFTPTVGIIGAIGVILLLIGFMLGFLTKKSILFRQKENEFKLLIEQERKAKQAAEDAIKARDEFLAIASHELKTPLTTIILRLQSTLDSILNQSLANFSGEKLVGSLNVAHEQTRRIQTMIKDLLDFSLITRGQLNLQLSQSDLAHIVKATVERFEDHVKVAGSSLQFSAQGNTHGLWDQVRIEQAVTNLLTNAIKYGQGTHITVSVQQQGTKARITVEDQGIGIDPDKQKVIFEKFKRGTTNGHYQGLGVGLFIVKQITLAHGGSVSVSSRPGKGSKFTIELPIKTPEPTANKAVSPKHS